jgi:hypothetical protein
MNEPSVGVPIKNLFIVVVQNPDEPEEEENENQIQNDPRKDGQKHGNEKVKISRRESEQAYLKIRSTLIEMCGAPHEQT